eukprot:CAMPEP_0204015306 /NCGR_PEP_ID=MMETSP0360-20130528/25979_1 /ASSEMBLY_ACC=CAM_ASM_000342 /TAXON_ID=268821 /ORGANISM="Scrippsiella Hangoei, Strain SHTV-5" /LENGTH=440 /DNA_ID=CAMNT_0050958219 /DNA_START=65 /DNA_END=1387 /DNA_ORIENTATION=+
MVVIKREPGTRPEKAKAEPAKLGYAKGAKAHYKFQVALISSVVPEPWTVCMGGLGSGIVCVRPGTEKSSGSSSIKAPAAKVNKDKHNEGEEDEAPAAAGGDDEQVEEFAAKTLPEDATVILLINSRHFGSMNRNGKTLGDYPGDVLDVEHGQMRWSSQHKDRRNTMLNAIVAHSERGGRIVVATRGAAEARAEEDCRHFKTLGEVSHITDVIRNHFLVEHGDTVIQERGSDLHHKVIKTQCIDTGLRSGIGLIPVKYRAGSFIGKWCPRCSYEPGCALLHFKELKADGVAAFIKIEKEEKNGLFLKEEREEGGEYCTPERPAKRVRKKGPMSEVVIKKEPVDKEAPGLAEATCDGEAPVPKESHGAVVVKTEPKEEEEVAAPPPKIADGPDGSDATHELAERAGLKARSVLDLLGGKVTVKAEPAEDAVVENAPSGAPVS